MIVAAVVWLIGLVCALAIFAFANHAAESADGRFSGVEIGWMSICWPFTLLVIGAVALASHRSGRAS